MTTDTTEAPALLIGDATFRTFTFEGKSFVIQHHPEEGSYASLADLCEIHWCGQPATVLPQLDQSVGFEDVVALDGIDPGDAMVNLDNEAMVTIRSLSANWGLAMRFREWLIAEVFNTSPHREYDEAKSAKFARFAAYAKASIGVTGYNKSAEEAREWRWREELKARGGLKLVWSKPPDGTVH